MTPYTIILADDHVLFRRGVKRIIEDLPDLQVIGEAGDGFELLQLLRKLNPQLIILDISMPNLGGLDAAREIRKLYPKVKILMLTMHKKVDFLQQGLEAGADGFLLKDDADSELLQAIQTLRQGKRFFSPLLSSKLADLALRRGTPDPLTTRERTVVKLLAEGKTSQAIADLLHISIFTVRRHRENIMRKLNFKNLADLIRYALDQEYTQGDS